MLTRPIRGVTRTRATAPHLPRVGDGELLVADGTVVAGRLDLFVAAMADAGVSPAAVWVASQGTPLESAASDLPVLAGAGSVAHLTDRVAAYLDDEAAHLAGVVVELRLAAAEAALADPQPAAPAGVVGARLRRGVAVAVDGALVALNPRHAGRALATAFAATHRGLLQHRTASLTAVRRTRDGLWLLERPIGSSASVFLFDDMPFAAVDDAALDALATTLRALLRRAPTEPRRAARERRLPPSTGDALRDTLLAVARANGRIAPAARSLGVHRNTVLYRLNRASAELGVDPRRPDDALRLLRDHDGNR